MIMPLLTTSSSGFSLGAILVTGVVAVCLGVKHNSADETPTNHDLSLWRWALTALGLAAVTLSIRGLFSPHAQSLVIRSPYIFLGLLVLAIAANQKVHGSRR